MTTKCDQLWRSIQDDEMRREFNLDVDTGLAFQIRQLRERNGWTQAELGERAGSAQATISDWEDPNYGSYTLSTLKCLATAFDVGLIVKFAPFSEVVNWNGTLTPDALAPPSFHEENEAVVRGATLPWQTRDGLLRGSTTITVTSDEFDGSFIPFDESVHSASFEVAASNTTKPESEYGRAA